LLKKIVPQVVENGEKSTTDNEAAKQHKLKRQNSFKASCPDDYQS
jgi:hypothetical protein